MKHSVLIAVILAIATCFDMSGARGLVSIPVACLREKPSHASQLVSQALMGTPVDVASKEGDWAEVTLPDGYRGYMNVSSFVERDLRDRSRPGRVVVTSPHGALMVDINGDTVSSLPFGSILELAEGDGYLLTPDGRRGIVTDANALMPLDNWLDQPFEPAKAIAAARAWMGAPYLWGGMSTAAMDCSGLVRLAWATCGRILPRDAWQQALEGEEVAPDAIRAGDLVFFDREGNGRITHVAIATDSVGSLIHCSGRVRRGSLDASSPDYVTGRVVTIRRCTGKPYPYSGAQ